MRPSFVREMFAEVAAIIEFDGSEWTKPSNMVYNIDNFKLEPFEYRTLTYDQLNDRLNIISPNFYYF